MARYYTDKTVNMLVDEYMALRGRYRQIQERFLTYNFQNEETKEFARHGFARRLGTSVRCIDNRFYAIPPELDGVPTSDAPEDAAIQVQAFILNVYGCLDKLAWMWVLERNVMKAPAFLCGRNG